MRFENEGVRWRTRGGRVEEERRPSHGEYYWRMILRERSNMNTS